jgi:Reverse transcriptase (RNA-dependent DNA polymerase)
MLANVTLIFKTGCKSKPENCRPDSLTPIVCTVIETIVKERMMEYLQKNTLFSDKHQGFARERSCLTNLQETFNQRMQALDEGYSIGVVNRNYMKAFNTVPHKRFIEKI